MCFSILLACLGLISIGTAQEESRYSYSCESFNIVKTLAEQKVKIVELEKKIAVLEAEMKGAYANAKCGHVAFRAQLTKDLGAVTLGQRIIYDSVELNIGHAFHPYHSVFTAPCNGTYLFSITVGNSNRAGVVHLKKNKVTVEYAWGGFNAGWDMGGVATVVQLVEGDDVWVEGRGIITGASGSDGVGDMKHTGFAGSLLHAF